jgi:MoaA/NifB/PqqE/SkfB family radical SAM enzyme
VNYSTLASVLGREINDLSNMVLGTKAPENVIWFLTERCNLECSHCFVSHKGRVYRSELEAQEIKRVLTTGGGIFKRVTFTGGEPLLYKDFGDVFLFASNLQGMRHVHVSTNGLYHEKLFDILKKCQNKNVKYQIQSSIDGPEQIHNMVRGNNKAFGGLMTLIEKFRVFSSQSDLQCDMNLIMTLSRRNKKYLTETLGLAKEFKIPLTLNFVRSSHDAKLPASDTSDFAPATDEGLSINEIKALTDEWCQYAKKYLGIFMYSLNKTKMENTIYFYETGNWKFPCAAGRDDAVILSDGSVAICEMKKPVGNLREFDFDYLKFWEKYHDNSMHTCYCTYDCAMLYSINKSVRGHATILKEMLIPLKKAA